MGASLKEGDPPSRHPRDEAAESPAGSRAVWPRFSANAARHAGTEPISQAGTRGWTAGELAALLCDFLKREHAALAACHGQRVEADWIPLARALAIRLAEAPGMSLATSPLKTRFLLREQIGVWLVRTALNGESARSIHIALPMDWSPNKVLAYLFRHEIAPMHHVTAAIRNNSVPIAQSDDDHREDRRVNI
jgi:hypothetical protein